VISEILQKLNVISSVCPSVHLIFERIWTNLNRHFGAPQLQGTTIPPPRRSNRGVVDRSLDALSTSQLKLKVQPSVGHLSGFAGMVDDISAAPTFTTTFSTLDFGESKVQDFSGFYVQVYRSIPLASGRSWTAHFGGPQQAVWQTAEA
jgi:hypothetical protein